MKIGTVVHNIQCYFIILYRYVEKFIKVTIFYTLCCFGVVCAPFFNNTLKVHHRIFIMLFSFFSCFLFLYITTCCIIYLITTTPSFKKISFYSYINFRQNP